MNEIYKERLVQAIVNVVIDDPSMYSRVIRALDKGLAEALDNERTKVANLAYALSAFVSEDKKRKFRLYHNIQAGLRTLYDFFIGSEFASEVEELLESKDE